MDFIDLAAVDYGSLTLDADSGKVKISFFDANKKAAKASTVTFADGSSRSNLSTVTLVADNVTTDNISLSALDDTIKYLKIEAVGASAGTSAARRSRVQERCSTTGKWRFAGSVVRVHGAG